MLSSSGRHRAPKTHRTATRLLTTAGIAGVGLGLQLTGGTNAHADTATTHSRSIDAHSDFDDVGSTPQTSRTRHLDTGHSTATTHSYTVVSGDSLSAIAEKKHVNGGWQRIYELNRTQLPHGPDWIYPGQHLTLDGTARSTAAATHTSAHTARTAHPATQVTHTASTASYANNLDGWIRQAQDTLRARGLHVPSYAALHATAISESGGNPHAVNGWDSNAAHGTPSIGLAQMIQPTFNAYALPGHTNIRNPVDNLIAASRYCDAVYGSMDNMAGARGYGSHWYGY